MLFGKFGKSISDKFLIPYNEKLYACDLDMLDCDAMGRFFPYANVKEIISNMVVKENQSYNGSFLYPLKGAETFINVLAQEVDMNRIYCSEKLIAVDMDNQIAKTTNYYIEYDYLINTMSFKKLLKTVDSDENVNEDLGCNKVLVFNLGFDKKSETYKGIHWVYIPDKDINFYRIGFYDNILDQDLLSMYIEIGYPENVEINVEEQLKATLSNLRKMNVISDHTLMEEWHCIMDPAYVYLSDKSRRYVLQKMSEFKLNNIFSIGRYGGWKYCSIEDCLIDANELYEGIRG